MMSFIGFNEMDDMFGRMDRMMASMMTNMNDMIAPFGSPFPMISAFNPPMDPMSRLMSSNALFPMSSMSFSQHMSPQSSYYSTSSSVMSMTTDMSGRPQIYESSHSSHSGPGGVRETRSSVRDSRTGLQKMAIGHHIQDRGHVMERARNCYSGEEELNNEYINIEEEEAPEFNQEFRQRIGGYGQHHHSRRPQVTASAHRPEMLALPAPNARHEPSSSSTGEPTSHRQEKSNRNHKMSHKKHSDKKTKKPYKKSLN